MANLKVSSKNFAKVTPDGPPRKAPFGRTAPAAPSTKPGPLALRAPKAKVGPA